MSRLTWAFCWQRAAPPLVRLLAPLVKISSPPRSEAGSSGGGKRGKKNHSRSLERRYQMANLEAGEMVGWQDLEGYVHGVPSFPENPPHQVWHRSCRAGDLKVLVGKNMGVRVSLAPAGREEGRQEERCICFLLLGNKPPNHLAHKSTI